jgi:hypothetical protein
MRSATKKKKEEEEEEAIFRVNQLIYLSVKFFVR